MSIISPNSRSFFFHVGSRQAAEARQPADAPGATTALPHPPGPWVLAQTWHDLLFLHWPVAPELLQPHLPPGLTLDTRDGLAWIAVLPFWMSGIRLRGCPPVPCTSTFPEINVRTYVHDADRPAVYFMSLDADNRLGTAIARATYHLPYSHSRITLTRDGEAITFASRRTAAQAPPATFAGTYRPSSPVFQAMPGSLEHWLVERYRFYTADAAGRIYRGDIVHAPWALQHATADVTCNTMALAHGITLPPTAPLAHYARRSEAVFWLSERVRPVGETIRPRLASSPG